MRLKIEQICAGHFLGSDLRHGECQKCHVDERNKECPDYKPITLTHYNVHLRKGEEVENETK